jgi:hypothetical protein
LLIWLASNQFRFRTTMIDLPKPRHACKPHWRLAPTSSRTRSIGVERGSR